MKYKHIVFDIDGTLIDSEKAILKSFQKTLENEGIKRDLSDLKFALGIPGKDALLKLNIENIDDVLEKWDNNLKLFSDEIILFDGIKSVIKELKSKNIKLGIITSRTRQEYHLDFIRFGIHSYFDLVICADDTTNHKPNKDPMEKYIELSGAKKEETIYIGDSIYDMKCSKGAGVDFALALWGANDSDKIKATYKLINSASILDII